MKKGFIAVVLMAVVLVATFIPVSIGHAARVQTMPPRFRTVEEIQASTRAKIAAMQAANPARARITRRAAPPAPTPIAVIDAPVPVVDAAPTGSVQDRIRAAWPGDDAKVLRVISCETGGTFDPNIRSKSGKFWGLFQADPDFRATYGYGPSVEEQVAMGWRGYQARGWSPWPDCGKR